MYELTIVHPLEINIVELRKFLNYFYERFYSVPDNAVKLRKDFFTEGFCGN